VTTSELLLELQRIDTEADQLGHRRERLPERDDLATRTEALREWERGRAEMRERLDALEATIERSESEAAEVAEHKARLESQLKTVIAPREAEALMKEIEGLDARRDELETAEIVALEEQSEVDERLTVHVADEEALRSAMAHADAALARATATIDSELAGLDTRRAEARAALDDRLLARYDRIRAAQGVAVATLAGRRCEGCHLDLSAAEVDDVKDAAASDGLADCPQCGRILVVPT
jgi:predicted  nucleic acid-binding Zn-ribbon protein